MGYEFIIVLDIIVFVMLFCILFYLPFPFFCYSRGFGFITFADPNSVDKVLAQGSHELDGKKVLTIIFFLLIYLYLIIRY